MTSSTPLESSKPVGHLAVTGSSEGLFGGCLGELIASATVPILLTDAKGAVISINAAARRCLDIASDSAVVGHAVADLQRRGLFPSEEGALATLEIHDAQCTPLGHLWMHRGPTAAVAARARYESADFLRGVIETDPTPIFVKDRAGRYVFINRAVADVFGKSCAEILGKTDLDLAIRLDEARVVQAIDARVFETGAQVHTPAEQLSDSTGRVRFWESWKRPLLDHDGQCDHILCVAFDRTRQVEIEHELRRNQEELELRVQQRTAELKATHERLSAEVAERLEAEKEARQRQDELAHAMRLTMMGELAAEIAHEVSQPLTAIFSYTQGCLRCIQSNTWRADEMETALNAVLTQAALATKIVRGMRDFLHKSEPQQRPVNPQTILLQSISLLEHEANRLAINVALDCPAGLPQVFADVVQIQQVVMNLLRNSFDALALAPQGTRSVSISARTVHSRFVEFTVEDNGQGVDATLAPRVFEPFMTTKSHGLGLGLSICRGIIVAHGGTIALTPLAVGTRVTFTLPVSAPQEKSSE